MPTSSDKTATSPTAAQLTVAYSIKFKGRLQQVDWKRFRLELGKMDVWDIASHISCSQLANHEKLWLVLPVIVMLPLSCSSVVCGVQFHGHKSFLFHTRFRQWWSTWKEWYPFLFLVPFTESSGNHPGWKMTQPIELKQETVWQIVCLSFSFENNLYLLLKCSQFSFKMPNLIMPIKTYQVWFVSVSPEGQQLPIYKVHSY